MISLEHAVVDVIGTTRDSPGIVAHLLAKRALPLDVIRGAAGGTADEASPMRWGNLMTIVLVLSGLSIPARLRARPRPVWSWAHGRVWAVVTKANRWLRRQTQAVNLKHWAPQRIAVGVQPSIQPNQITLNIPPDPRVVIAEVVVVNLS